MAHVQGVLEHLICHDINRSRVLVIEVKYLILVRFLHLEQMFFITHPFVFAIQRFIFPTEEPFILHGHTP